MGVNDTCCFISGEVFGGRNESPVQVIRSKGADTD